MRYNLLANSTESGSAPPSRARCANRTGSALLRPSVGSARTCRRLLAIVKCNEKQPTRPRATAVGRATRNVAVMRQRHTSQPAQPIAECGAARCGAPELNECPSAARRREPSLSDAAASASRGSARLWGDACVLQRGQPRATHGIGARPSARSVSPSTRPRRTVATACARSIGITQSNGSSANRKDRTAVLCGIGWDEHKRTSSWLTKTTPTAPPAIAICRNDPRVLGSATAATRVLSPWVPGHS